jgi:hypothetical protein
MPQQADKNEQRHQDGEARLKSDRASVHEDHPTQPGKPDPAEN